MNDTPTVLREDQGRIAYLTLNRPHRLNALSRTLLITLKQELDSIANDDGLSVVVIRAAGRAFSAGYDLNEEDWILSQYPANFDKAVDYEIDKADVEKLLAYWLDLWKFPKPIIAAVDGPCLSGGGELLAICDLVIAGDKAQFGHPAGRNLGIPVTLSFWPMLVGIRKARELLYTAKLIGAQEAERIGLVNYTVASDELESAVHDLATNIARTPVQGLEVHKRAASSWAEQAGLLESARISAELDAQFHQSPTYVEFFQKMRESGLKPTLALRDA